MPTASHTHPIRVRYSETDQMQNYYNSRVLEWFECGRTELIRSLGRPYREWETEGYMLPVVVAHVEFVGRAQYDDLLNVTTRAEFVGKARIRFDIEIADAETGREICRGHTVHAIVDATGRPKRPAKWIVEMIDPA